VDVVVVAGVAVDVVAGVGFAGVVVDVDVVVSGVVDVGVGVIFGVAVDVVAGVGFAVGVAEAVGLYVGDAVGVAGLLYIIFHYKLYKYNLIIFYYY